MTQETPNEENAREAAEEAESNLILAQVADGKLHDPAEGQED